MILLLDTSTPQCHVVLIDEDRQYEYEWQADRQLAKGLLAYLRDCLAEHKVAINNITAIGVMKGPGSFTGLRIGSTVCNTLARELKIPIVGTEGSDWQDRALQRLECGESDEIVLPNYGSSAHITQPRK